MLGRMTTPGRFRKKPVVIEAMQWDAPDDADQDAVCAWLEVRGVVFRVDDTDDGYKLFIPTLEGEMRADQGDWIIRGVAGEFYPCKPDIFAATYEPEDRA